jgi:RNA polymerase sigma factor
MDNKLLENTNRDEFIESYKGFIYKTAQKICKKILSWENDDELSIALTAFNKACDTYNDKKGDFFSYSKLIIKNSLIDFFRKSAHTPYLIFDEDNENSNYIDNKLSMDHYAIEVENSARLQEITLFSSVLKKFKLDFNVLADSSPSHSDTRTTLLNIAFVCSKSENILNYINNKKLLPVKEICLLTGANKKMIEKWRRYILTLILILSSDDYPYIRSFLNIKVGDDNE